MAASTSMAMVSGERQQVIAEVAMLLVNSESAESGSTLRACSAASPVRVVRQEPMGTAKSAGFENLA